MRHNSLNQALEARQENLSDLWVLGSNIAYGQTVQHIVEDDKNYRLISVYRDTNGVYEEAITYITGKI